MKDDVRVVTLQDRRLSKDMGVLSRVIDGHLQMTLAVNPHQSGENARFHIAPVLPDIAPPCRHMFNANRYFGSLDPYLPAGKV